MKNYLLTFVFAFGTVATFMSCSKDMTSLSYEEVQKQWQQAQIQIVAMENSNKSNIIIEQMRIQADLQKEAMKLQANAEGEEKDRLVEMEKEAMKQQNENARFAAKIQQENTSKIAEVLG